MDTIPLFKNGMPIGLSGFAPVGDPKIVPIVLSEYVEKNNLQGKLRFNLFKGGSSGEKNENRWGKNNMIANRYPYQNAANLRKSINSGKAGLADKYISMFP